MFLTPRRTVPGTNPTNNGQINARVGYLSTPPTLPPAELAPEPIPEPPAAKVSYLGAPPPVPVALPTPTRPRTVADNIPNVPTMDNMEMVRNAPMPESPSLLGRSPVMTEQRNVSGIENLPSQVPQQSDDINGLSNNAKYVRGQEAPTGGMLGQPRIVDPLSQARSEVGELKPLGFWGRLGQVAKGALLGVANSGGGDLGNVVGSAIGGGLLGGTDYLRKQQREQQIGRRTSEIAQANQYERQAQQDDIARRTAQVNMDNIVADNKRQAEVFEEQKRKNAANEKLTQERQANLAKYRQLNVDAQTNRTSAMIRQNEIKNNINLINQPGLSQEQRNEYAEKLNALGQYIPNNYNPNTDELRMTTNPTTGEVSVVNITKGTAQGVTGQGGQPFVLTPKQNVSPSDRDAQAKAEALAGIQQDPNAPPGYALSAEAQQFIQNNDYKADDPNLAYLLKSAGINNPYVPITKTEQYNQKVIQSKAGVKPQQTASNKAKQPPTNQDLEYYKQNRDPRIKAAFQKKFGVDPDTLIQ